MTIAELALRLRGAPGVPRTSDADLVAAADAHGVAPLLHAACRAESAAALSSSAVAVLARAARESALVEEVQRRELCELLALLARDGVAALLFKGTALAYSVYEEPWMRPRADTDLLVRAADAPRAAAALERFGCRRIPRPTGQFVTHQFTSRCARGGVESLYDVHWRAFDPQVFADVLRFEDLAARSAPVTALGPDAQRVGDADALVIACIHRLAHHFGDDTLIRLYDIDRLARRLDADGWHRVNEAAVGGRVAAVCLDGLLRARALFETPLPPPLVEALDGVTDEPSATYLKRRLRRVDILISDLRALPSWRTRLRLLREHLFPPADYARHGGGGAAGKPLPFWYLSRICRGAVHWFGSLN